MTERYGMVGGLKIMAPSHDGEFVKYTDYKALEDRLSALTAESQHLRSLAERLTSTDCLPEYHYQGMGCGLEDRGIHDRYEAMYHGWESALDRVAEEVLLCPEDLETPVMDEVIDSMFKERLIKFLRSYDAEHKIACALADYEDLDDETLQSIIWVGYPPEPMGDVFTVEYVQRAEAVVNALKCLAEGK